MQPRSGGTPALIGRSAELAALQTRVGGLATGAGAIVVISGEAGSGKTRLVEELLARLKAPVIHAVASVYDYAQAPYAPIRDLLATLDARAPKVLAKDAALRSALEPIRSLGVAGGVADPQAARRHALDAAVEAITKYAAAAPLVLVIEDVQWIDQASADVLAHLSAHAERSRLMLTLTYRTNDEAETEAGRDLVSRFARRARGGQIALRALTPLDARSLVDAAASAAIDIETRRTICELADGNPLLLLELTGHAGDAPRGGDALPLSLQAIVDERIAAFDDAEKRILQIAALLGEFDAETLAAMAGVERGAVLALLRHGLEKRVLSETSTPRAAYSFRHALIRRAVSEQLLAAERTELHLRIARMLEERIGTSAATARHYELAGETTKARSHYVRAGAEAQAALAFADASDAYRRAIGVAALDDEALEIGWKFLDASDLSIRRAEHMIVLEDLYRYATQRERALDAAHLQIEISRWCFTFADDERAVEAATKAFAILDGKSRPELSFEAGSLAAWYLAHMRKLDDAAIWIDRVAADVVAGTLRSLAWYHEARAAFDVHSGACVTWRDDCAKMLDASERQHPEVLVRRLSSAAALALASNVDDFAYARECMLRAEAIADQQSVTGVSQVFANAAYVDFMCGDLASSRKRVLKGLAIAGDDINAVALLARTGIPVALRLGDDDLLRRCTHENILDFAYQAQSPQIFGPVAASFAEKLMADDRRSEAALLIERIVARLDRAGNNLAILTLVGRWNIGPSKATALKLLEELAPSSRSGAAALEMFNAYGSTGETRKRYATHAAAAFDELGWKLWQAEALELAGRLDVAREIYTACGSVEDTIRLETERGAQHIPGGLSRREWDVALLVAQGKSNRAIAEALSLSERTVENHIASIFNKRSLRSRAEIASFVAREERLPVAK